MAAPANPAAPKQPQKKPAAAAAAANPQAMEELKYIHQMYQNQYMQLAQEVNIAIEALKTLNGVQETLEHMPNLKDKNTLIPIGSNVFMDGKIASAKSVVIGVGAGYLVEKNVDSAKAYVAHAIYMETQQINKLNRTKKELEAAMIEVAAKVEEMSH